MNNKIYTETTNEKKIDVDEIVKENTDSENDEIVKEYEMVKECITLIRSFKHNYLKEGKTIKEIDEILKNKFSFIEKNYTACYKMVIEHDDSDLIYNMLNSLIDVAKKKASFGKEAQKHGQVLHERYIKNKIDK